MAYMTLNYRTIGMKPGIHFWLISLIATACTASGAASARLPMVSCPNLEAANLKFRWEADFSTCDNSGVPKLIPFVDVLNALRHGPTQYAHEMAIVSIKYVDQNWDGLSDAGDRRIPNGANVRLMSGANATKVSVELDEMAHYYCFTLDPISEGKTGVVRLLNE